MSRWSMMLMCVPMLVVAGIVVLNGGGVGTIVLAVACALMMMFMMRGMSGGDGHDGDGGSR